MAVTMLAMYAAFFAIPIYYFYRQKRADPATALFATKKELRTSARPTLVTLGLLFAIVLALGLVFFATGTSDTHKVSEQLGVVLETPWVIALILLIGVPAEEVFFRGWVQRLFGPEIQAVLFGLAHFSYGSLAEVVAAIALGYALGKSYARYKNLYAVVFAHMLYNTMVILLVFVAAA